VSEVGIRFGITEPSHARINFPSKDLSPLYTSFTLDFQFRTPQRSGILWVWASYKHYNRYFLLCLELGFLTLEIRGHKEPKTLQYKVRRLSDNQWHHVRMEKEGRELKLQVDDSEEVLMRDAPNPKVMRKRMYVGGVISRHRREYSEVIRYPGFSGCIRAFKVDGEEQSLVTSSRDLVLCVSSPDVAYIHDEGFITFEPLREHEIRPRGESPTVDIAMQFRPAPRVQNASAEGKGDADGGGGGQLVLGLLSASDHAYQSSRLVIRIHNSILHISAYLAKHRVSFEEQLPPLASTSAAANANRPGKSDGGGRRPRANTTTTTATTICPGQWNRLELSINTHSVKLTLDGEEKFVYPAHFTRSALEEIRSLPIHVGGSAAPVSAAFGTKSLHGCIKGLEFAGRPVELGRAKKWHKVVLDGCPY